MHLCGQKLPALVANMLGCYRLLSWLTGRAECIRELPTLLRLWFPLSPPATAGVARCVAAGSCCLCAASLDMTIGPYLWSCSQARLACQPG